MNAGRLVITLEEAERRADQEKAVINGAEPLNGTIGTIGTRVQEQPARQGASDAPDLSLLGNGRTQPPKFPTDLLGKFWEDWCVGNARAKCCPIDYVVGSLISVAASLVGNARRPSPQSRWMEPAHLWVGLVGSPSSGKTPGMSAALEIISQFNRASVAETKQRKSEHKEACERAEVNRCVWREAAKKNPETALPDDALQPEFREAPRYSVTDTTPERLGTILDTSRKGVLSIRDELAGWICGFDRYSGAGGAERAMWLEAWNGGHYVIDRQKSAPIVIDHLSVGIIGGIQPDRLCLISGGSDDGLASRFIWFWPEDIPNFKIEEHPIEDDPAVEALAPPDNFFGGIGAWRLFLEEKPPKQD
jgi:hypothetical protein